MSAIANVWADSKYAPDMLKFHEKLYETIFSTMQTSMFTAKIVSHF